MIFLLKFLFKYHQHEAISFIQSLIKMHETYFQNIFWHLATMLTAMESTVNFHQPCYSRHKILHIIPAAHHLHCYSFPSRCYLLLLGYCNRGQADLPVSNPRNVNFAIRKDLYILVNTFFKVTFSIPNSIVETEDNPCIQLGCSAWCSVTT